MSVDDEAVVDAISINQAGKVVLTIADHREWSGDSEHLPKLQKKIYAYLDFIDSGELLTKYPKAEGKKITIQLVPKYPLSAEAIEFIDRIGQVVKDEGVDLLVAPTSLSQVDS